MTLTPPAIQAPKKQKILLQNRLSPGDILVMTAAIESLRQLYPNTYLVGIDSGCGAIFENNPFIINMDPNDPEVHKIDMQYPLIDHCNQKPVHFIQGYHEWLAKELKIILPMMTNRPHIYINEQEKKWLPQVHEVTGKPVRYWIINAGVKQDYTNKNWGYENYQTVIDMLRGEVQFVQVGEKHHLHRPLKGVINMIGKTDARQLIRMCWNAEGGLGPITFVMHLFAAFQKPYVALMGGREPMHWEHYPTQTTMSTLGQLPCCRFNACWKSRTVPLGDNDKKDESLCELPVFGGEEVIPKCMAMITPEEVVRAIERYYIGGVLTH
jgi:ADP-heptose:LPS heptosyltransferase